MTPPAKASNLSSRTKKTSTLVACFSMLWHDDGTKIGITTQEVGLEKNITDADSWGDSLVGA